MYIVLPQDTSKKNLLGGSQEWSCTHPTRGNLETVLLDNTTMSEDHDRDWAVVAHETLHALGLPNLYFPPTRSFCWSMMADMRSAWHLLVTGWCRGSSTP